jgi:hypothetical protein
MGIGEWFAHNAFDIMGSIGIIGGLWFTAFSLRSDTTTRRTANLIDITASHRDIWKLYFASPELARVFDRKADISKMPITQKENVFVNMLIAHIGTSFYLMKHAHVIKPEGLQRDIKEFMALPIPKAVWEQTKAFQNDDFVAFVESCLNAK